VAGSTRLSAAEIGEAVYPFLGPMRTEQDVENAKDALQAAYREKGFESVTVEIPPQEGRRGIIVLKVVENKVGRLRVRGSRYFSLSEIKRRAPSLAEGELPNFNEIQKEIVGLSTWPDRRIKPTLRPGVEPGTVDIDLEVKDTFPLHGSVELNNRYSPDTTPLRINGSLSYSNLWQLGHSVGFSFQVAPERPKDATIYSGYYLARFAGAPWFTLMLLATKQESDVATLGGVNVVSPGETFGVRAGFALPDRPGLSHTLTFGFDYKHLQENTTIALALTKAPVTYYPLSLAYTATLEREKDKKRTSITELEASVNFHVRSVADREKFQTKRFGADTNFFYFRGDLGHTQELPKAFQLYARVHGQASGRPLINSEQFSGGGLETARGYLESAVLGDNGLFGTLELRSPSLISWWTKPNEKKAPAEKPNEPSEKPKEPTDKSKEPVGEWRLYAFLDAGFLRLVDALPEQTSRFELASYGIGSRLQLFDHLNGSVDVGVPLIGQGTTRPHEVLTTFRVWGDF
jgi:hemolysin activation/secretion protein